MARVKDYKAKTSGIATKLATEVSPTDAVVLLPPNPRNHRLIDLRPWLGREFDDWVWAMTAVLQARLNSGLFSVATIVSFSSNGIKVFLPFLTENHVGGMPSRPSDMGAADVSRYIAWLKLKYPNGSTAKNYYSAFKSVMVGLMDYGFIDPHPEALLSNRPHCDPSRTIYRIGVGGHGGPHAHHWHAVGHQCHATTGNEAGLLGSTPFHAQSHAGQNLQA